MQNHIHLEEHCIYIKEDIKMSRLTDEQKAEIQSLYEEGYEFDVIATMLNIPYWAVTKYSATTTLSKDKIAYRQELRKEVITKLFNEGKSVKEIADKLEVKENTIQSYLQKYKLSYRGRRLEKEKQELISLLRQGYTYKEIAARMGKSEGGIIYKIKNCKIDVEKERSYYKE